MNYFTPARKISNILTGFQEWR